MTYVNEHGYVVSNKSRMLKNGKAGSRNWWIVRARGDSSSGTIPMKNISFKKGWVGKRVRFKVEIIE